MLCYKEKILTPGQLKRLGEHKYNCESSSILDKLLQPWWNWLVEKVPFWLAPNLITVVGLIVNILTTLILIWYSPDAKAEAPRWAFAFCAIGLFIYQSLDAIDGKQARRTNTSSPLGELFDHGCDSVSTVFVAISACIAVQLGFYPTWMFFQCFCAVTLFYCAHWQTYVSGMLRFGRVDVTEAQFTIMAIHLVSAFFGPEIWSTKIFSVDFIQFRHSILAMTIICGSIALYNILFVVFTGGVGKNGSTVAIPFIDSPMNRTMAVVFFLGFLRMFLEFSKIFWTGGAGKNGSTVAGTSVLSPIFPLLSVVGLAIMIAMKSPENVYEKHPCLYILAFGLAGAKVTNRLVVAHMSRNELVYFDAAILGPAMLFLNQYFNCFITEYIVLWICMLWVGFDLVLYSSQVCMEICDHLRIRLFKIIPMTERSGSLHSMSTPVSSSHHQYNKNVDYDTICIEDEDLSLLQDDEKNSDILINNDINDSEQTRRKNQD